MGETEFKKRSSSDGNGVWKWVAGILSSIILSILGTASFVRTDTEELRAIIKQEFVNSFTEISKDRGMYIIEGKPRIERLEQLYNNINVDLDAVKRDNQTIKLATEYISQQIAALSGVPYRPKPDDKNN